MKFANSNQKTGQLFGMNYFVGTSQDAIRLVIDLASQRKSGYMCFSNAYTCMLGYFNRDFHLYFDEARQVFPDGTPLIWALRSFKYTVKERIYGPETMEKIIGLGQDQGIRHFLYGGEGGSTEKIIFKMKKLFPNSIFCGSIEPPFRPLNEKELHENLSQINSANPHIVWIGLGAPKQEAFMNQNQLRINALMLGVGAAFPFHSGLVRQAPKFLQRNGLEWLFRLAVEPQRLWRRTLWANSAFLYVWVKELLVRSLLGGKR